MYLSSQGRTCYITWKCNGNASQYTKSIQRLGGGGVFVNTLLQLLFFELKHECFKRKREKPQTYCVIQLFSKSVPCRVR